LQAASMCFTRESCEMSASWEGLLRGRYMLKEQTMLCVDVMMVLPGEGGRRVTSPL
jgi:hypothetical protein